MEKHGTPGTLKTDFSIRRWLGDEETKTRLCRWYGDIALLRLLLGKGFEIFLSFFQPPIPIHVCSFSCMKYIFTFYTIYPRPTTGLGVISSMSLKGKVNSKRVGQDNRKRLILDRTNVSCPALGIRVFSGGKCKMMLPVVPDMSSLHFFHFEVLPNHEMHNIIS